MELWRRASNPWGQDVLLGISWDLMWAALVAAAAFVVGHALWMGLRRARPTEASVAPEAAASAAGAAATGTAAMGVTERVSRHSLSARVFHWLMSLAMLALLITAFVPVMGWQFPWVMIHWIAGVALVLVIAYHVVHATFRQDFWSMWLGPRDLAEGWAELRGAPHAKPGKYPADHKLYHHLTAVVSLAAIVTGLLMMLRIDTPFLARNPYLLGDGTWGVVYVVHGLAGVALIGLIAAHIYFAIRPEKRWITWSMIRGWIARENYLAHHDPERWTP